MTHHLLMAAIALVIDRLAGYPDTLYRQIGHPVSWVGRFIGWLDGRLNRPAAQDARLRGAVALAMLLLLVLFITLAIRVATGLSQWGIVIESLIAATLLAQRSLADHVQAVADGLAHSIERGRATVRKIVGRDTAQLDESGVAKAAIESLAESMSDGVVAPLFWLGIGGLPGIALYKAVNTADSMIGHLDPRYRNFGWAAARLDDLLNLVPARLTGLLIALAALVASGKTEASRALSIMRRDAGKHRSPNAGYPEAAMAGALGLGLGGSRAYAGETIDLPSFGDGVLPASRQHIANALRLYRIVLNTLLIAIIALLAVSA